ncbi:DUF3197 domain-containing protein [Deinococcus aquiradiocola]|uniref:DUF3197 domain-containing protein n=1 Tax=Deinococcus aquiradiocola TaxID=393059 RepID=A0A917UT46_9DEIO|nr:DUF3197 domain-containing protein [Deinococcus aquiradiocola]GGJ83202.1 hypothetical protein GCM10008939_28840 [Deinococcus aquiradiocola]
MTPPASAPSGSSLPDLLGLNGAPDATLHAVLTRFQASELRGGRLILLTDRQGERSRARYAALVEVRGEVLAVTGAAFGPHFGRAGTAALAGLVEWAQSAGLSVRETVVGASQLANLAGEPDAAELAGLIASSSPSDPGIYLTDRNVQAGL